MSSKPQWNGCRVRILSESQGDVMQRHLVEGTAQDGKFRSNVSLLNLWIAPVVRDQMERYNPNNKAPEHVPVKLVRYGVQGSGKEVYINLDDLSFPRGVRKYCLAIAKGEAEWVPEPDGDGKTRLWGLDPRPVPSDRFDKDSVSLVGARSHDPVVYPTNKPEAQLATLLGKAKLSLISSRKKARHAVHKKEFVLKVALQRVTPEVFRIVRVSGSTSLRTLQNKILQPAMGWARSYHGYYYTDLSDGTIFGDEADGNGVDSKLLKCYHGHSFIDDREVLLGDLVENVGDEIEYLHDLGVRWEHSITVEQVLTARRGSPTESVLPAPTSLEDMNPNTPMGMLRCAEFMQLTGHMPEGFPHIKFVCIGGAGACPPEDGNGVGDDHAAFSVMGFEPATGTMSIDTLWVEMSGNDKYNQAVGPGGVLVSPRHAEYKTQLANAFSSTNYQNIPHGMGSTFQPRYFDVATINARVCDALQVGCECDECSAANAKHWRARRAVSVCEQCLLAAPKLKTCGRCEQVFYCTKEPAKGLADAQDQVRQEG